MALRTRLEHLLFRHVCNEPSPIVLTQRRIFILPTRSGLLFSVVLGVMLIGAINYTLSLGHALVFLLAGLGLVAMVHTFRNLVALRIRAGRSEAVFAGETAHFPITLENTHHQARRALEFAFAQQPSILLDIPPGAQAVIAIPCSTVKRGRLNPGRITLSTTYPLGLFRAWSYPHPELSCLVYPAPLTTPLPPASATALSGLRQGDTGQEDFTGLRLHQPNDSPRHIAWKTVAHDIDGRPLLIKQFAGGATEELWLDWSMTPSDSSIETRLSILCGWILAVASLSVRFGLRLPSLELTPDQGSTHRDTCLEALALYGETSR